MLLIAAIVFAAWLSLSFAVLALCAAAGRADRALELLMPQAAQEDVQFVLAFAEPQTPQQAAAARARVDLPVKH